MSHYRAVQALFHSLVSGIQFDVDRLITKAYSANPRPLLGKEQVDASSIQHGISQAEKARSFLSIVLNRIETDPSGESYKIFLKILSDEQHLVYLADRIKDEVERISADERSTSTPRNNDRPDGASPFPQSTPTAGDGSFFGMPKREKQDSGIASFSQGESDEESQVNGRELVPHSPLSFPTVSSHPDFRQVSDGVLVREEDENIPIAASDREQQSISDTQEPGADATSHPMVVAVGGSTESLVSQYPSIKKAAEGLMEATSSAIHEKDKMIASLKKEKGDLQSELAESKQSEKEKVVKIQELGREKERTEYQLKDKRVELEGIIHKRNTEIKNLKGQLQKKDEEVKKCKEQVALKEQEEEREIEKMRQECEERIKTLEDQKEAVQEKSQQMKQKYEARIRELKKTVKAAEEQKGKAEIEKAQIEAQLAQKEKEYTEMVLKNEREVNQLKMQLKTVETDLKLQNSLKDVELAQERQKNAEMNLEIHRSRSSAAMEQKDAKIKNLEIHRSQSSAAMEQKDAKIKNLEINHSQSSAAMEQKDAKIKELEEQLAKMSANDS